MNTKILLSLFTLLMLNIQTCFSTTETFLWPIKGIEAGKGIIWAPQGRYNNELNHSNLFIRAPKGTDVLAPTDAVVKNYGMTFSKSLVYQLSFRTPEGLSFDDAWKSIVESPDENLNTKYITGSVSLYTTDGKTIHISGLMGKTIFKTGQKIKRGDVLGQVAHAYQAIPESCIQFSIDKNSKISDPMGPFGLKSSFVAPGELKAIKTLTQAQAKDDFNVLIDALKEAYPTLYQVISKKDLETYIRQTIERIEAYPDPLTFAQLSAVFTNTLALIHDSHLYLHTPAWNEGKRVETQPRLLLGWLNDTLRCLNATKDYTQFIGKEVISVNGVQADSAKRVLYNSVQNYDAQVESYKNYRAAVLGFGVLFKDKDNFDMNLTFADGQTAFIPCFNSKKQYPKYANDYLPFLRLNAYQKGYDCKMLNDSTAYIGLSSFSLDEVAIETIASFIDSIKTVAHLIIDVRNNPGGQVECLEKLYSYIAGQPFDIVGYNRVYNKGVFKSFKNSMNYTVDDSIFSDYVSVKGYEGFYEKIPSATRIEPDSLINYKGKVYVLTNENSVSAATIFPALLVRNHRGLVIGRETRTAYHYMTAMKFSEIRLPNSTLSVTIPLVESVFDTVVNARVPYGRGVIPDYTIEISLDEINFTHGDAILNYTLDLIAKNVTVSDINPFEVKMKTRSHTNMLIIGLSGLAILLLFVGYRVWAKKKKQRP